MAKTRLDTGLDSEDLDAIAIEFGAIIVPEIAPDEQNDYGAIVAEYCRATKEGTVGDHPLAYGMGELVQLASPLIYEAAKVVVLYLIAELGVSAKNLISEAIKTGEKTASARMNSWLRKALSRRGPKALSSAQRIAMLAKVEEHLSSLKTNEQIKRSIVRTMKKVIYAE